jgi:2'-5' RNA ligase
MNDSWRVFAAIELPVEIRQQIQSHIDVLRRLDEASSASWTRVDNAHLTVKFFGQVKVADITKISDALAKVVQEFVPFRISVGGVGVFPKPSNARVLWIGVNDETGELATLQRLMEDECARVGFEKEERPFRPHLTIARIRQPGGARELANQHLELKFETISLEVKELVLFRSELNPKGSKYTALAKQKLATD